MLLASKHWSILDIKIILNILAKISINCNISQIVDFIIFIDFKALGKFPSYKKSLYKDERWSTITLIIDLTI